MKQRIAETDRADLIKRIANLPPANRALLEQKLKVQGFDSFIKQIISRRATRESAPLSYSQRRLWFLDQYEPNSSVYNVPSGLRLKGALEVAALERSLNEIVHRHEALRTTFSMVGGEPVQAIAPSLTVALSMEDLSGCAEEKREEKARQLVREEAHRPFDLSEGPLFRSKLVRLGDEDHILLLTMHHIVSDGWSMGVLQRELSVLYRAFMNGHPSPLVDLSIQYGDFAKWQGEWLQGEVLERQLSYWKGQLEGIPAVLNLPTDHPRPAVQSYRGRTQSIELSKGLTEGLKGLSRKEGVTLFMVLLAAFQTLLYRYTGQGDVVVGSPIANRNRSEIEGLIGFFVNTLVLRSDLSGNPSFRELLGRVRKMALEAYEHQDLPFEKLVEELQPERSLSYSPLFQVMFVLQNAPSTELELEGLGVSRLRVGGETAKFDLTLSMHETAEGLSGSLQYKTDVFDDATITRMLGHLQRLLEGVVAKPDEGIGYLPILSEAEERQLLIEWNDTRTDYPRDKCIHGLFETQVEKTPDAIALVFEDQQLTYSELNTRANQLARYLQKLGVGPEVLVGICVERSIEMVVGLLGILKAGGGYLPLDVNYPAKRLEFMLADAQVSVLLTQSDQFEDEESRLDDSDGRSSSLNRRIQRICLDRDWEFIITESDANPGNTSTADNLAYVIYTSGSTGRPKGVAIEHRNTVGFLSWVHSTFTPEELSAVFAATSICFDLSVFEIFAPLTCGGTIILAQNALALAIPNRTKVSLLNTVPSAMNELLTLVAIPQSVRVINLAGEPLRTDLVRRIYESTSVRKVHDLYGPTECTTYSTWTCRTPDGPQTIGRPIVNTQVYILDGSLNPVPVGVAGELHIGGDGLARGYLNRPELTAEKFIHNPFSADPTSRLYKTGDLSRYLPDGNIEFLGRIDHQVKIRGYRIELGEIESVLRQHRSVPEAVVLAREESPGDKQLVAYVVFNRDEVCTVSELRSFLRGKLPDYMVPSAFVALDSLPLTPNGKVDRKALPAPDQIRPELQASFVAPRTPIEEIIAEVWAEVLKLGKVGIHDNFFDLGGHSLLATQIISRVRDAFQMDIPLRTLFEKPTVAGLAERFEEIHQKKQGLQILPLLPVSRDKDLPLSFAQQRLWFLDQLEPGSTVYNVPGTVRIRGQLNVAALDAEP